MSHTVQIDYSSKGEKCLAICEQIDAQIASVENALSQIDAIPEQDIAPESVKYLESVRQKIVSWANTSEVGKNLAEEIKQNPIVRKEYGSYNGRDSRLADLGAIEDSFHKDSSLITATLQAIALDSEANGINRRSKIVWDNPDARFEEYLSSIKDENKRQFIYLAHCSNPDMNVEQLEVEAQRMLDIACGKVLEKETSRRVEDMRAAGVDDDVIEKALTTNESSSPIDRLTELYDKTSGVIVDEKVRRKVLQFIKKTITAKGFIIAQGNIKKRGDVVTMLAQKPGGETAIFTVYLDGKFVYDFKGYEGQACQQDIEPFLKDLEEVYGVELSNRREIWRNPDRLLSQKKQTIKENSNTK